MISVKVVASGKKVKVVSTTRVVRPRVSLGGNYTPLATAEKAGKIRLTGDLGGTALSPTVPGLAGKEPFITAGTISDYWSGNKTWLPLASMPVSDATQAALNANWEATKQRIIDSYRRISLYNVLDGIIIDEVPYYAVADGTTDNTEAVQKIFDYVSGIGGGEIWFPAGEYLFENSVWIRDSLVVNGIPNASTLTSNVDPALQEDDGVPADQRMYGIFRSDQTTPIYKGWTCRNLDFLGNVAEEPDVPQANRVRNPSPFHAIKINGSAAPVGAPDDFGQPTSGPYITNIVIDNITVRHMASLPVTVWGVTGRNILNNSLFRNCKDVGYVYNEEVICTGNHSINSSDNGFSLSRGNRKVVCSNNTVENAALFGIWLSGYNSNIGPSEFVCSSNVVRNCGRSCLNFDYGPSYGSVVGNYLYQGYHRGPWDAPSDTGIDGITIAGASGGIHATGLLISGNIIDSPARNGIAFKELNDSLIANNLIINPGTAFKANLTTPINAGDTTSNNGICPIATGSYSNVRMRNNYMVENRDTPLGNWPVSSAGTGGTYPRNNDFTGNWRNVNNTLTISDAVMSGQAIIFQYAGTGSVDVWHNMAASGKQFFRSADGSNIVINSTSTSVNAKSTLLFSAGSDPTSWIGAITAGRRGDLMGSIMSFRPYRNSLLVDDGKSAPLWIDGRPTNSRAVLGLMGGQVHQITTLSDISYSASAIDFLIAYTSLSALRTVTLPDATTLDAGQVIEVADWSGQAGIYGIKIAAAAAQTIDGVAYALISSNNGIMRFYTDGTNWHTHAPNTPSNVIAPIDYGFLAQNMVLSSITGTGQLATPGKVYVMKMRADKAMTITNIHIFVTTQGSGLTTLQNYAALYSSSKTLLAQTGDQTTAWGTVGMKTMALSSAQTIPPGYFYVAMWANGTTMPTIRAGASGSSSVNGILSTANSLFATADSSITTTAPSTLGTFGADTTAKWVGVS